jgi:signal transduction histidine kinase
MRVAVVSNYMAHDYLRSQHPEIRLEVVPDVASGLSKVSLGEVDAYVENMANATYYLQTGGITNLRLAGYTSFPYQWGIGIRSDWPELQGILNKGLAAITKEERQAIINQWIYLEGQPWKPSGKFILTGLAFAALALLSGILARNYSLRHEIARRILAEEQVRELNVALEQRVAERTAELEQSNRDLESFSYSVSHDLRGPLRLIGTSAAILLDDYSGSFDEEGERLLQILTRNTRKMELLIDDLLLFSRVRTQDMKNSSIDMTALAREVFEELSAPEGKCAVSCTIPQLIPALGEPGMIRQVLVNLLANAIKFSVRREDPRIEVGCIAGEKATVYYVKDNGIGFDMQYAERLFEVFSRLNASQEYEGTGIGLAIVKRVIQKHGGKVWAEGKEGEGATFFFSLPN